MAIAFVTLAVSSQGAAIVDALGTTLGPDLSLKAVQVAGDTATYQQGSVVHAVLTVANNLSTGPWPAGMGFYGLVAEGSLSQLHAGTALAVTCPFFAVSPPPGPVRSQDVDLNFSVPAQSETGSHAVSFTIVVNPTIAYGGVPYCPVPSPCPVQEQNITGQEWRTNIQTISLTVG
ncbi:MAG: hypothetical protein ACYDDF_15310 [Thermoplasmatota archaeon]